MSLGLTGLEGKVAIVTGAGRMRGLGHAVAVTLAKGGCDVVVTGSGRSPDRYPPDEKAAGWRDIESVAERIEAEGRKALPLVCDVADPASVGAAIDETLRRFGRIDFLVNNASAARGGDRVPVTELPIEEWDKVYRINCRGVFLMSQAVARKLVEQGGGGSIVNVSSIGAVRPGPSSSAYSSSKAAVEAFTVSLALELAAARVRVNAVCPGAIETARMDVIPPEEWKARINRMIPLGRASDGRDVAHLIAYLCSEEGSWITGDAISIDGGMHVNHQR